MTLKEKFKNAEERYFDEALIETNIKIADEFGIDFMEWVCKNYRVKGIFLGILDSNDLLKDYKKEKKL